MRPLVLAALLVPLLAPAAGAAEPTRLTFSVFTPPTHFYQTEVLEPWAEDVARVTDGRVEISFTAAPLAPMPRNFDLVASGGADISGGTHGSIPGRFAVTQITKTPLMADVDAEAVSVALWRTHQKYLAQAEEHAGTQVLTLHSNGPAQVFTNDRPVTKAADFEGLKLVVPGPAEMVLAENLGATPIRLPGSDIFDAISKGVVDGAFGSDTGIKGWKAEPYLKHELTFPGGLLYSTFYIVMNADAWDRLAPEDQAGIMSVSGEALARRAGAAFDAAGAAAVASREPGAIEMHEASPELQEAVLKAMDFIDREWLPAAQAAGIDGPAALDYFRAQAVSGGE